MYNYITYKSYITQHTQYSHKIIDLKQTQNFFNTPRYVNLMNALLFKKILQKIRCLSHFSSTRLLHVKYGNGIIDNRYEKVQVLSKFFTYGLKK